MKGTARSSNSCNHTCFSLLYSFDQHKAVRGRVNCPEPLQSDYDIARRSAARDECAQSPSDGFYHHSKSLLRTKALENDGLERGTVLPFRGQRASQRRDLTFVKKLRQVTTPERLDMIASTTISHVSTVIGLIVNVVRDTLVLCAANMVIDSWPRVAAEIGEVETGLPGYLGGQRIDLVQTPPVLDHMIPYKIQRRYRR